MFLSDDLAQPSRPHARRQRLMRGFCDCGRRFGGRRQCGVVAEKIGLVG
jgi:hypothetical protein